MSTTFLTGTLTSLIAELAGVSPDWRRWTLWGATLACMVIGAAAGVAVFTVWRSGAPLVSVLIVGIVAATASWLTRARD
jgi:ABC-type Mn2+/Zn2+ transport system permease subunit